MNSMLHNLSFNQMQFLPMLINTILKERGIIENIKCGRKKATALLNNILGPFSLTEISNDLKGNKFSIVIDERTDISTKKCLVLVVRYYDGLQKSVKDKFFGLIELKEATDQEIYDRIIEKFDENNISVENIIGFASDNASVMTGSLSGVKTSFVNLNPNLLSIGCTCHNFNLCSYYAGKKMPKTIEKGLKCIYNYFAHSSKRLSDFEDFQEEFNVQKHKILQFCPTRWLSLENVINRVLEQWQPLLQYFILRVFEDNDSKTAEYILEFLRNNQNKVYLNFLSETLKIINTCNKIFQSEETKIHVLTESVKALLMKSMKNFIKQEYLSTDTDFTNNNYLFSTSEIYFGLYFEQYKTQQNVSQQEIAYMQDIMLKYYLELCIQIKNRFDILDTKLKMLKFLNPENIIGGSMPSILGLIEQFPYNSSSIEVLNEQWRNLIGENAIFNDFQTNDIAQHWIHIGNITDEIGNFPYKNLSEYMLQLCCLPHSSASAERKFSDLKVMKDVKRNSLNNITINNLLLAKELIINEKFFQPSKSLLNYARKYKFSKGNYHLKQGQ